MKKISLIAAAIAAIVLASCGNGTPTANLKSDVDTLCYAIGMTQSQGLKEYLVQQMGVDTAYIDEFVKGMNAAVNAGDDKKKAAYLAGIQIGQQVNRQMLKGLNYEIFGEDSTQSISVDNFMAGFVAGTTGKKALMTVDSAANLTPVLLEAVKSRVLAQKYGDNKAACEKFMAEVAEKDGEIHDLGDGIYYEILTEGTGAIPTETDRVKVHYEGKLINDTIFDSSYKRDEPSIFRCNQVIAGWTKALTHMPVGSTWLVYIPQEQAYGSRDAGLIPPFSCLIFKIELLEIVTEENN